MGLDHDIGMVVAITIGSRYVLELRPTDPDGPSSVRTRIPRANSTSMPRSLYSSLPNPRSNASKYGTSY